MERERSGKIPWIVVLLLVAALCALSYLAMITAMGLKVSRTTYHKVSAEKIGWALGECGA